MAPLSIDYLSKYLINERTDVYKEWFPNLKEEITEEAFRFMCNMYNMFNIKLDESFILLWKGDKLPWNGQTCLLVLCHVIKLDNNKMHVAIGYLDSLAKIYHRAKRLNHEEESQQIKERISFMFVNDFMPMARKFFQVPKLNEVLVKDNSLKKNEILASFLDFLLQILNSEALINLDEEHKYDILQKELTFLLSLLGDMPFRYTELEDVNNILGEIESFANEVGNFIYSCVFTLHPDTDGISFEGQSAVLGMVQILNTKIKEHCMKFSKSNSTVISQTNYVMDSIFIVDSLIEDLENMMNNQIHLIVDELKVEITTLHQELMISRSLLKDIRRPQDTVHMDELTESSAQVRDVAYEAEYLVNSYVVGNIPLWYFSLRLPVVISKFKLMRMRIQETKIIYDIKVLNIKKDYGRELVSTQAEGIPNTNIIDIVVGFEVESAKIFDELCGRGTNRQIITIFGMPGIGKTTLANKLFNDSLIHFDECGSSVVSQTYIKRKVLIDILVSLSKSNIEKVNISEMDDEELSLRIHQCLIKRRYLIYLDDVWSMAVLDDLQRFFPDEGNGSRIILTSRIKDVWPTNSIVHSLPLLTEEQSWSLLEMKVFLKEACPPQLHSIGKRIAAKCGGLPLSILVTAGALINFKNEESQWKKVETNLDSYIFSNGTSHYSKILELSFKHLPNHLKMCFLYVGAFPEDTLISVRELTRFWISEGFIQREQEKSLELIAEEYLTDLINRSLIQIATIKSDGRISECRIHDQLRKMCLRISHEDLFSKSVHVLNHSIYEKNRRMFDNYKNPAGGRPFGLHYRTFSGNLPHSSSRLPQLKLLRVMNLEPDSDSSYELKKIDLLVHLRYLCVNKMPKLIHGNFVNLEFLLIYGSELVYIPLFILKLVKLRHLLVANEARFEEHCYNCQCISSLRYFSGIGIYNDKDNDILRCLPHLVKLKCRYFNPTLFPDLRSQPDLQILHLSFHCYFSGELTKVNFPSTITSLSLSDLGLPWEEISIIGRLPNLRVLKLNYHAFVGEIWETMEGEFQELMFLRISCNETLKEWITYSGHFPNLQCLEVNRCINLEEIPSEIGEIPTLEMIKVYDCGMEAYESAVQIVKVQHNNGNKIRLDTKNELKMEEMVQEFQKRNLEKQEYRLKHGY